MKTVSLDPVEPSSELDTTSPTFERKVQAKGPRAAFGRLFLRVFGWKLEGAPPATPKYVVIAAPHTTNWDLPFMLATAYAYDLPAAWIGKHSLFKPPFGGIMRLLGGIPVRRDVRQNLVEQMIDAFKSREELALAVPPEGTRGKTRYWKTGFYYIALGAGVPIATGYLDYDRKVCGFGPVFVPTGEINEDMRKIRAFYSTVSGKHQQNFGLVEFDPGKS